MQGSGTPYDIVVVGAGPAGSAAAYFLATGGLRVALLDKFNFPRDKTCGDGLMPRAVKILDDMKILKQVEQHAYRCSAVTVRHSDEITYRLELAHLDGFHRQILILPRMILDDLLRQHAVSAGVDFFSQAKVVSLLRTSTGTMRIQTEEGRTFECALVILATGANSSLLRKLGLLKKPPPTNTAARAYFENVDGLDDTITLFFDDVELPGYGWIFPTGPRTANIGCGVFFDSAKAQTSQLREMIEKRPHLRRILRNAKQVGPIKGFPLRTDFSPAHSGKEQVLVAGEAAGLVNPITGEGIDYALESAQLAARAILNKWEAGPSFPAIQRNYRAELVKKFHRPFMVFHLGQRLYVREGPLDRLLRGAQRKPQLRRTIADVCFGSTDPIAMFTPRILWDIFGS